MNPPDKYSSLTDDVRTSPPPLPTYEYTDIISGIDSLRSRECTTRQRRHTVITHDSRDSKYILSIVIESTFARHYPKSALVLLKLLNFKVFSNAFYALLITILSLLREIILIAIKSINYDLSDCVIQSFY